MAVEVGLTADINDWVRGMRAAGQAVRANLDDKLVGPFQKSLKQTGLLAKGLGNALFNVKTVIGGIVFGAAFHRGVQAMWSAVEASREFSDSMALVKNAVRSLPDDIASSFDEKGFEEFRKSLSIGLGIVGHEVNRAYADFITRGAFSPEQAQLLTLLAANMAQKTKRSILDVQKQISDATMGSADAIKELGLEIAITGNKTLDAEKATRKLIDTYGDIGTELVNPSQKLNANLEELRRRLGEEITPLLDPLIEKANKFMLALGETRQGEQALSGLRMALSITLEYFEWAAKWITTTVENTVRMAWRVVVKLFRDIQWLALDTVRTTIDLLDVGRISEWLGFDGIKEFRKLLGETMDSIAEDQREATSNFMKSIADIQTGGKGPVMKFFSDMFKSGDDMTKKIGVGLNKLTDKLKEQGGFVSQSLLEEQSNKLLEETKKELDQVLGKYGLNRSAQMADLVYSTMGGGRRPGDDLAERQRRARINATQAFYGGGVLDKELYGSLPEEERRAIERTKAASMADQVSRSVPMQSGLGFILKISAKQPTTTRKSSVPGGSAAMANQPR